MTTTITVYSRPACVQCNATYRALKKGLDYETVDLSQDADALEQVRALGHMQAPVIITATGEQWSGFRPDKIEELAAANQEQKSPA